MHGSQTKNFLVKKEELHITAKMPLKLIFVYIVGSDTFQYLLTIVDVYSKFTMVYTMQEATTNEIIRRVQDYSLR